MNLFLDELQLDKEMEGRANAAAADPSEKISYETMILGLLTKQILPEATVLGFSRSGDFFNREFLNDNSEVYTFEKLSWEDVETFVKKTAESEELGVNILEYFSGLNSRKIACDLDREILFIKLIVEIVNKGKAPLGEITTPSDLLLAIIRRNLEYQNSKMESGFTRLPPDLQDNLKKTFKLCKENLQKNQEGQTDQAGVINGTIESEEMWVSPSGLYIPLSFLTSVGIFEAPPSSYDELTLAAKHLSYIEFFAAAGILLSSDIKSEMKKIENRDRLTAVALFIRKYLVTYNIHY